MLVVKVELWPGGSERDKQELAQMVIANDMSGDVSRGNYWGRTFRKSRATPHENLVRLHRTGDDHVLRNGVVHDYPRKSLHVWNLVSRMLKDMGYK